MSVWSHVAMVFRIDGVKGLQEEPDFEKVFGQTLLYNDPISKWHDARNNPSSYLPLGSEGSLEMSVWENPDTSCVASYTVTIFGDLRDHEQPEELITWFREKCSKLWIRQAVITIDNNLSGVITETYGEEEYDSNLM